MTSAPLFGEALALMLNEHDPRFANWDQDDTAVAERYWAQAPAVVADELGRAAAEWADAFDQVAGAPWARTGRRRDGATFTVASFAQYFLHDVVHHLHDVGAAASP